MISLVIVVVFLIAILTVAIRPWGHKFSRRLTRTQVRPISGLNLALVLAALEVAALISQVADYTNPNNREEVFVILVVCGFILAAGLAVAPIFMTRIIAIGGLSAFLVETVIRSGPTTALEFAVAAGLMWLGVSLVRRFTG